MDWIDDLSARLTNGDDPSQIFEDFKAHRAAEAAESRRTPIPTATAKLMAAFEAGDWDTLEPWLNGDSLTAEATRMLLDGWDIQDAVSQ